MQRRDYANMIFSEVSMGMARSYRIVVVILAIMQLLWYFIPWGFAYPGESAAALFWLGKNSVLSIWAMGMLGCASTMVCLLCYIGLFLFKSWGRRGFFLFCIISGIISPLYGISVQSGYEGMLGYFMVLGNGALLAASFYSPIKDNFEN